MICVILGLFKHPYIRSNIYSINRIVEKELCHVQARKSFNNGRYGNALDWALRSQDNLYVSSIADLFLRVSIHLHLHIYKNHRTNIPATCDYVQCRIGTK